MERYRQAIPDLELAVERGTPRVPDDGYFYVLFKGETRGRHRTLKKTQTQYREIAARQHWKPAQHVGKGPDPAAEAIERYMDSLEAYWTDAPKHRRRGGKTMYRS